VGGKRAEQSSGANKAVAVLVEDKEHLEPNMTFGAKLSDAMLYLEKKILPTPTARDYKDAAYQPIGKRAETSHYQERY
jgi:hypothetical protein